MDVFGRNVAKDLLKNPEKIKKIILQDNFSDKDIISLIEKSNLRVEYRSKREMDDLSGGVHQGIILTIPDYQYKDLNSIINSNNDDVIVILDHLEDPHNFGAIIRTCEALGINGIIIPNDRSVNINSTVVKTSVGAIEYINIIRVPNLQVAIKKLKENNFWIIGTDMNGTDYRKIDYNMNTCLVIGNEGKGISNVIKNNCDYIVTIPMKGKIDSLNASVSCGIILSRMVD